MVHKKTEKTTKKRVQKEGEGYTAKDIYVLKGLEPVRKRPGMYIGSTGPEGLHHLVWEVLDNGIDECMAGYANEIAITLLPENRVKCEDNGRGIPVEKHPQTGKSALETVMTTLHAGAKFGGKAYQVAGGLHGVGVSVVCALTSYMRVEVCRGGTKYFQEYSQGRVKTKVKKIGKCKGSGTTVIFEPDPEIFKEIQFDTKKIINHLRQQAYLTPGVKIIINDERVSPPFSYNFYFEGGVRSYVRYLVGEAEVHHPNIFYTRGEKEGVLVEIALQYAKEMECFEESFANNINTGEGGMHLTGFRTALTRTLNDYARKNGFLKEKDENLMGNDVREGLVGVVSVKLKEPQFEGQTKAKLGNPEAKTAVEAVLSEGLNEFLEKNPQDGRAIIENCLLSARARQAAKAARTTVLRKGILEGLTLPGKLADCSSRDATESELYIVEGNSAGGCFSGNTKIALIDGRNLTFKQLIEEEKKGKRNYCYTIKKDKNIGIGVIKDVRRTRQNTKVIKVILDNDEEIICTPDHKFMLRNGEYEEAKDLTPENSLMPLYRKLSEIKGRITIQGYEMVFNPLKYRYIFTHLLVDQYNLKQGKYQRSSDQAIHHKDFNKLNNYPDNIIRMNFKKHLEFHRKLFKKLASRPEIQEKLRKIRQTKEFREKVRAAMLKPRMRKILSERAKKQWENKEYKQYMIQKYLEFYQRNSDYREKNREILYKNQKKYWSNPRNRRKQTERVRKYFNQYPEKRKELSLIAKKQWQEEELLEWRRQKTMEQWIPEFRKKRKKAYNQTYLHESLKLLREIFEQEGNVNAVQYDKERKIKGDKNALKYQTVCHRFFNDNEEKLKEAVLNYNHRVKKIVKLSQTIDVYDLEVEETHNFALACGVFVHNSGKMARNRRFQAILPLRGKVLNVERARLDKILSSQEIKSLIIALGTAFAQDFNIEKLRYHRVILMADADSDGNHIRTLLLTLFFRHFREIIERGYLYIAQPPLYRIQSGKRVEYAYTEADKAEVLSEFSKSKTKEKEETEERKTGISIQRYKGLGEMNPEQLWETTMNPENRVLLKVYIEDAKEADRIFDILMGKEVLPRKKFIQVHAKKVKNLDI